MCAAAELLTQHAQIHSPGNKPAERVDLDAPAALILHFCLAVFCQQNPEALPEAGWYLPARKPTGSGSTVPAVRHGPCVAPGLAELPAHGALCSQHSQPVGAWLLQVYSGTLKRVRHHYLLVALSSQEDQGGCRGSLCQFCWHRDQRKPKRKSEKSTQPAALRSSRPP